MIESRGELLINICYEIGGFQLVDLVITELKDPVINLSALIVGKFICKKILYKIGPPV